MSPKGMRKQAMPAPKLMAIENEYHRTKNALEWEIRRLQREVGVLAKRYNNARREIEDLVKRVRSQPPPPILKRDEEMEKRKEEQNKRWIGYLERESERKQKEEVEKKQEEEKESAMIMETTTTSIPEAKIDNKLIPVSTPLNQNPPPQQDEKENKISIPDVPEQTQLDSRSDDVEMTATVRKKAKIMADEKWLKRLRRKKKEFKEKEYLERGKQWCKDMVLTENMDIEVDLEKLKETTKAVVVAKKGLVGTKKYEAWVRECTLEGRRAFSNAEWINAFFYLWGVNFDEWEVLFEKDHISVEMEMGDERRDFIFKCGFL